MSSSLTTLMQRALYELDIGKVIPNADISAIAASSFTAARFFQNTNMSPDFLQLKNAGAIRAGAATAANADLYRPLGTLTNSSGVVLQVGPTWADITVGTEEIELWYYGVRRDQEVLKSLNRVITEKEYITMFLAVSHLGGQDGDMALSTDSLWTDVGTTSTSAKATTAGVTPWGPRSYHTVNNAVADSGTRSASMRVMTSKQFSAYVIAASEVGTSSLQGFNNTGSAVIGSAVTSGERKPQLLAIRNQDVGSTTKLMSLNLTNTSATGDSYWDQAWLYLHGDLACRLPALVTDSFMAPKFVQAIPREQSGANAYDAGSFDFRPLTEGQDYWLVFNPQDAEPYKVRFANDSYFANPIFVEARVPNTTLSAETDVAYSAIQQIVPRFKKDLLETVYNIGARRLPDWNIQYNLAKEQIEKAALARPISTITSEKAYYRPRTSVY